MRCNKKIALLFTVFLLFFLTDQVFAVDWHFPDGLTPVIPDGMTWHFGDYSIGTTGTDVQIVTWFISDWLTYTVDSSGTQEIYEGSKPTLVFVDEVEKTEGTLWSYSAGTTTITDATSQVSLFFGTYTPPSTGPTGPITPTLPDITLKTVLFKVTVADSPCEGCMIKLYELPYEYYSGVCFSDSHGLANMTLDFGEYKYEAEYEGMKKNDTFLHIEQQTIEINFEKARLPIRGNILKVLVAVVVLSVAVYAISKVRKF